MKKMKPKKFTQEQLETLLVESQQQTLTTSYDKSADPENYPVLETPINRKVFIYVPNHTKVNAEGIEELVMDKPLLHTIKEGKAFLTYRCVKGLSKALGYSERCPICDGEQEPWDLAKEVIKDKCRIQGLNVDDKENEAVKSIKKDAYNERVIRGADRKLTFPIIVFDTSADAKTLNQDEDGNILYKPMWYSISEAGYAKKWEKIFEGMEDEPTHPGGHFFVLNYCYEPKNGGEPSKRDCGREMTVVPKTGKAVAPLMSLVETLDELTKDWTPLKAQETIYENMYYEESDLEEMVSEKLQSTRERLAVMSAVSKSASTDADGGFKITKKESEESAPKEAMGIETDLDD